MSTGRNACVHGYERECKVISKLYVMSAMTCGQLPEKLRKEDSEYGDGGGGENRAES